MMTRRSWASLAGLLALAAAAISVSAYSGGSTPQGRQPIQPINFPHPLHVGNVGMNCVYCHFAAFKSPDPGLPAVGTCLGCHAIVSRDKPEVKKLLTYANGLGIPSKPIPWVRIHRVPQYVHFPHMRHVNAGVTCQTCHGEVQTMMRVYQASSLNMGWCISCHLEKKVRYDCSSCHY
jgi:hypothetical protein